MSDFLTRDAAAAYITEKVGKKHSRQRLANLAISGDGPVYRLFGQRAVYSKADLDAWIEQRLSPPIRSTAELHNLRRVAA